MPALIVKGTYEITFLTAKDKISAIKKTERLFAGMGVTPGEYKIEKIEEVQAS